MLATGTSSYLTYTVASLLMVIKEVNTLPPLIKIICKNVSCIKELSFCILHFKTLPWYIEDIRFEELQRRWPWIQNMFNRQKWLCQTLSSDFLFRSGVEKTHWDRQKQELNNCTIWTNNFLVWPWNILIKHFISVSKTK